MKRTFETIKKSEDFKRAFNGGRKAHNKCITLFVVENGLCCNRIGPVISKKVGNSVVRHRFSRLIREIYRLTDFEIEGYDIVVAAHAPAAQADYHELRRSFYSLAQRLCLL